jgi:hypothetical protein
MPSTGEEITPSLPAIADEVIARRWLFAALHESAYGTKRTCRHVCYLSAFRDKADISPSTATPA